MSLPDHGPGPDVSIVMPVFNKLELTRDCLESIHTVGAEASFEIIVVDNGSSDGSAAWLAEQQAQGRLRLVGSGENLGFARGCNLGARSARGRHILFLNNDMQVLPGWLDPLVTTLDRDPEVGIAGAKLLFPDNTLQHAGVALVEVHKPGGIELGGIHLCHRKPATWPGTNHPQLNQVVTGACLLIRRELFNTLEGFDEGYWNGNEDVDMCLRAGRLGWKVVYRPESVIYHFESQSGAERWTAVDRNVTRFNQTWQGVAVPDFIADREGGITACPASPIAPYTGPRLRLRRPAATGPGTDPRVSVIVLTWNALDYTRQCAESLLRHTAPEHELIFVDNGSRQDTLDYLAELEAAHRQVKVIRNGRNLGFAAGNNLGIAAAGGDHVCLLNSDTVVTAGWLEALLAPVVADARVGLVGPVTNSISGGQKLPEVPYDQDSLQGLDQFAAGRAHRHRGQRQSALMVVGFCLLVSKRLIERIGGLDEGFGQGNYEDTDYCLRAYLAGFKASVALDSFVHHFGSRSFVAGGVDYARQIGEKFTIFRRKWDLPERADSTAELDLDKLLRLGFREALHFHPLPAADGVVFHPLAAWEETRWLDQGEVFFQNNHLDEAERVFRAVLALRPDSVRAANDLACALWQQQDPARTAEAVAVLTEVLRRDPGNADAVWNLEQFTAAAT